MKMKVYDKRLDMESKIAPKHSFAYVRGRARWRPGVPALVGNGSRADSALEKTALPARHCVSVHVSEVLPLPPTLQRLVQR